MEAAAEGVLDLIGEKSVDRVRLVAREMREAAGRAVGAREAEDAQQEAQEARVKRRAVGDRAFAVAADDSALSGREIAHVSLGDRRAAGRAGVELGEVARLAQQVELEREERLFVARRLQIVERGLEPIEQLRVRVVLLDEAAHELRDVEAEIHAP